MSKMIDVDGVMISVETIKEACKDKFSWDKPDFFKEGGIIIGKRVGNYSGAYEFAIGIDAEDIGCDIEGFENKTHSIGFFEEEELIEIRDYINTLLGK